MSRLRTALVAVSDAAATLTTWFNTDPTMQQRVSALLSAPLAEAFSALDASEGVTPAPTPQPTPAPSPQPTPAPGAQPATIRRIQNLTAKFGLDHSGTHPRDQWTSNLHGDDALVVDFTTNAAPNASFNLGVTHAGGQTGSSHGRQWILSTKENDFDPASPFVVWHSLANVFAMKFSSGPGGDPGTRNLAPSTRYFLMMMNQIPGRLADAGIFDVFLTVADI